MWENPSEKLRVASGREHTMDSVKIWETHRAHGLVVFFGNNTTHTHTQEFCSGILISIWEAATP